ncbi:MAG: DUF3109 family protein [Bacteroidia bacterium]|nr:DUF3109 family protein [Bacteroidia bacterium]MDW8159231.1 DUF3109 family protein [Bacteroidia bacterium]
MLIIENVVIPDDVLNSEFACKLSACKGACCLVGEAGAPLTPEEADYLQQNYSAIAPFLTQKGKKTISEQGTTVVGEDGELETPLVNKKEECAYAVFENGIIYCGIEKAYYAGAIDFQKPISCHLYPVRITHKDGLEYLQYQRLHICAPACVAGRAQKIPLFRFLRDALIRKYGNEFYELLEEFYKERCML